jgi:uncharacterized protein (TIGR00369 family)
MSDTVPSRSDEDVLRIFRESKNKPNSSKSVGFEVLAVDQAAGTVKIGFTGTDEWINPMGLLQGGYLTTMLDEALSTAGIIAANFTRAMPTLELKVSFLRPASPGKFIGIGKCIRMGKSVAFLEAELYDENKKLVAKASATAYPQPIPARA